MPSSAYSIPRRAVLGELSPRRARMNSTDAVRYAAWMNSSAVMCVIRGLRIVVRLEHPQHSVGDDEATNHIDRRRGHREGPKDRAHKSMVRARENERSDKRDTRNSVGRRHQWCV